QAALGEGKRRRLGGGDIRVRFNFPDRDSEAENVIPLKGNSASGAAAAGLWFMLTGKEPDQQIIVLAQVMADGLLEGVEGIKQKVRAIVGQKRFDTIIVASSRNASEVVNALRDRLDPKPRDNQPRDEVELWLRGKRIIKLCNLGAGNYQPA